MRILISTPIYPPEIGGPAMYAERLLEEFRSKGHDVRLLTYGLEKRLPMGVRHLAFFLKAILPAMWAECILALDTFSAGVPTAAAAAITRTPYVLRIGGDFLWEMHVERTKRPVLLPDFYAPGFKEGLTRKERIIYSLTRSVLKNASVMAFTTPWLLDIWNRAYALDPAVCRVIENVIEPKFPRSAPDGKRFLWAGRSIFLKNAAALETAFVAAKNQRGDLELEMAQVSRDELKGRLERCYAVVIPSLSEVSPNFALDAVRHGKPFILTRYNGLAQDVRSLGLMVDPLDTEDIKSKLLQMADDAEYDALCAKIDSFDRQRRWIEVAADFEDLLVNAK